MSDQILQRAVRSYMERWAAERAADRVYGVTGVAEEIEDRSPFEVNDTEIAQNALQVLSWDADRPANNVTVKVEAD